MEQTFTMGAQPPVGLVQIDIKVNNNPQSLAMIKRAQPPKPPSWGRNY